MLTTVVPKNQQRIIEPFLDHPPVDVVGIAAALGIRVWESKNLQGASGKLFRDPLNGGRAGYSILVNARDPLNRKRFTIAHEIAHYLLHASGVDEITDDEFYRSGLGSVQEAEANKLAAEILMPEHLLQDAEWLGTPEMARRLQVSELALSIRLSQLTKSGSSFLGKNRTAS